MLNGLHRRNIIFTSFCQMQKQIDLQLEERQLKLNNIFFTHIQNKEEFLVSWQAILIISASPLVEFDRTRCYSVLYVWNSFQGLPCAHISILLAYGFTNFATMSGILVKLNSQDFVWSVPSWEEMKFKFISSIDMLVTEMPFSCVVLCCQMEIIQTLRLHKI